MIFFGLESSVRCLSCPTIALRIELLEQQGLIRAKLRSVVPLVLIVRNDLRSLKTSGTAYVSARYFRRESKIFERTLYPLDTPSQTPRLSSPEIMPSHQ